MKLFCCAVALCMLSLTGTAQKISFSEVRSSFHTHIKGSDFEGVVFSKDFAFPFISDQPADKRFTPSVAQIEAAEKLLTKDLKTLNVAKLRQGGSFGPVIHENLNKFVRQYYGYINDSGDSVVYISCLTKGNNQVSKQTPNWLKGAVLVLNGGSNYWQIQANLSRSSLFGLGVNGLDKSVSR